MVPFSRSKKFGSNDSSTIVDDGDTAHVVEDTVRLGPVSTKSIVKKVQIKIHPQTRKCFILREHTMTCVC